MYPVITNNDLIEVIYKNFDDLKKYDIILFEYEKTVFAHRIVKKYKNFVITKGDNSKNNDDFLIYEENYIGFIENIEKNKIKFKINSKYGILFYFLGDLWKKLLK